MVKFDAAAQGSHARAHGSIGGAGQLEKDGFPQPDAILIRLVG